MSQRGDRSPISNRDCGGTASLTTSTATQTITLNSLAVTGTIALSTNGAGSNAAITNATGIVFAASSVGGNLTAVATTGNISDSGGVVTVGGNGSFTTSTSGALINLNTAGNLAVAATGTIAVNTSGVTGNASVTNNNAITFAASSVGGNLTAVATTGNISDSGGVVTVGGNGASPPAHRVR